MRLKKDLLISSEIGQTGVENGVPYVDLGLSVNWATCNVGASSPEGIGTFFTWDEANAKSWEGSWMLPSAEQIEELCNQCTWQWANLNDIDGYRVTGPNGNSIFLPAKKVSGLGFGKDGGFWSASLGDPDEWAFNCYYTKKMHEKYASYRNITLPLRLVFSEK